VIKTLVSIEVDLASSAAVRFACHLGSFLQMEIQPVYVKEFPSPESAVGSGWARHTWEKELLQEGREEISAMIMAEMDFCPILKEPLVVSGDHEAELFKLLEKGSFDLYVEGVHFSWNQATLHKQLHSRMRQRIQSPMVLVRSLRKMNEVLLLCLDTTGTEALTQYFRQIWQGCSVPLVLALPVSKALGEKRDLLEQAAAESAKLLGESGIQVTVDAAFPAIGSDRAEQSLKDYGLVAIAVERSIPKDCAPLRWMNCVKTSCLVALYNAEAR
jgi:hypothetical protein